MGAFKDFPLVGSMFDFLMALVRLIMRLKIHGVPQVINPFQYHCDHRAIPGILMSWEDCTRFFTLFQCVIRRAENFTFRQDIGNLRRTVAPDT